MQKQAFAQPIVFFRLDLCLSILIHSTALTSSLTSLRIRIPTRPVARPLCTAAAFNSSDNPPTSLIPPDLVFLDLSTCGILENELDTVLVYFTSLQHVILDGCTIPSLRGDLHDGEYNALGKRCALVGVRRAKEREKLLRIWLESRNTADGAEDNYGSSVGTGPNGTPRNTKRGRKGLATSTISFRTPSNAATSSELTLVLPKFSNKAIPKIRILPPLPCLLSLSVTAPTVIRTDNYPIIRAEFEVGWAEGIAQLGVTRARMRTSAGNGVRVMRLVNNSESASEEFSEGFEGLVDIDSDDFDAFETDGRLQAPVLCFGGANGDHSSNCGHTYVAS